MRTPGRRGTGWKSAAIACLGLLLGNLAQAVPVSDCTEDALTAALAEGGVVNFTTDCALPITAPIVINRDVSLTGIGFKVTLVSTNSRIFEVASGVTVTLDNITIASSRATNGGALYIQPGATATLTGCSFVGNLAVGADGVAGISAPTNTLPNSGSSGGNATPGHPALGGAILNMGTLSCSNCIFLNNRAYGGLGAAGGNGENGIYQGGNGGNASSGASRRAARFIIWASSGWTPAPFPATLSPQEVAVWAGLPVAAHSAHGPAGVEMGQRQRARRSGPRTRSP